MTQNFKGFRVRCRLGFLPAGSLSFQEEEDWIQYLFKNNNNGKNKANSFCKSLRVTSIVKCVAYKINKLTSVCVWSEGLKFKQLKVLTPHVLRSATLCC